jgi:multisubunit Na+/H+ antiporter MnhF subunit
MVRYAVANTPYISILMILFLLPFVQSVCYIRALTLSGLKPLRFFNQ